jgi:hypothetical protein
VSPINDSAGKPVNLQRRVGIKPILAVGNSDGDIEMMEYTASSDLPVMMLLLRHDDAEREFAYDEGARRALELAADRGWQLVSMKNDFVRIFPRAARGP